MTKEERERLKAEISRRRKFKIIRTERADMHLDKHIEKLIREAREEHVPALVR